jgi:hypothetical protein
VKRPPPTYTDEAGRRWLGSVLEAPVGYVMLPLDQPRPCVRCKARCYTARPRQKAKGVHPLCDTNVWFDVLTQQSEWDTEDMVMDTLGVVHVEEVEQ